MDKLHPSPLYRACALSLCVCHRDVSIILFFFSVNESPNENLCAQSCPTLCDLMDCIPPGSSVHGIFQARILEGLPFPPLGDLPDIGIEPSYLVSPALGSRFFTTAPPEKVINVLPECVCAKSLQWCPILCDSKDSSPPGSSVHHILHARILEWIIMPTSSDLPDSGIETASLMSPALAGGFLTTIAKWKAQ